MMFLYFSYIKLGGKKLLIIKNVYICIKFIGYNIKI